MAPIPPRRATLVLSTPDGDLLGCLPELAVETPWWHDAAPVVEAARATFDIEITLIRLLDSELPRPHGGGVTYLAEVEGLLAPATADLLQPGPPALHDEPLRPRWARPGGPGLDLAWAEETLCRRRLERVGPARQVRTWNLSSIWELPLRDGSAWLKVVPPFFAHEGDILRRLQDGPVPHLLGHDGDRILMAGIPGEDRYDAALPELLEMLSLLVAIQAEWLDRADDLLAMRLPDWRGPALAQAIRTLAGRRGDDLSDGDRVGLDRLVEGLAARLAALAGTGIPDTLVHGDAHPGNVRGRPGSLTLLDWGDCGVGHPLLDLEAFLDRIPADAVPAVRGRWLDEWRARVPGSDPDRAAVILAPLAAARQALIYQAFVDGIEPVERRHHDADVVDWLGRAARLAIAEG